jgi:hypothetical protein
MENKMETKIDLVECKKDYSSLSTEEVLELLIDKFSRRALDTEKITETHKCLAVAEKSAKLLESFAARKGSNYLLLDEVLTWISTPIRRSIIYQRYYETCIHRGLQPMTNQQLYQILRNKGVKSQHKAEGDVFLPLRNLLE